MKKLFSGSGQIAVVVALSALVFSGAASAETAGDVAKNIFDQMKDFANAATAASFLAGIILGISALFKFKAYADNPQQTKIAVPIIMTLVAVCLIALPAFLSMGRETVLEGDAGSMEQGVYEDIR